VKNSVHRHGSVASVDVQPVKDWHSSSVRDYLPCERGRGERLLQKWSDNSYQDCYQWVVEDYWEEAVVGEVAGEPVPEEMSWK